MEEKAKAGSEGNFCLQRIGTHQLSNSKVHLARLWLTLPNLPTIRKSLIAVASAAGTPLEFDLDTVKSNKLTHPRVRVHIAISMPVNSGIWINWSEFGRSSLFMVFLLHVRSAIVLVTGSGDAPYMNQ